MAYQRKTRDRWDIMTNWGYGWECENSEYTREDAKGVSESTGRIMQAEHLSEWKSTVNLSQHKKD